MPRRDLSEERTEQILDAFERCIIRHGLESSSLEKVAEEAGMKRPIIRHYVGNRDDLILALTERFVERDRRRTLEMMAALGEGDRIDVLLRILFSRTTAASAESILIYENLILLAGRSEMIRNRIAERTTEFLDALEGELLRAFPEGSGHRDVAWGILSLYYNHVSLQPLQLAPEVTGDSHASARRLVDGLTRTEAVPHS